MPLIIASDIKHSHPEQRYYALGRTDTDRRLFIAFSIRDDLIRVISARDMTKEKQENMAKELKEIPTFKSEDEEREFWTSHDSTEYIDWGFVNFMENL